MKIKLIILSTLFFFQYTSLFCQEILDTINISKPLTMIMESKNEYDGYIIQYDSSFIVFKDLSAQTHFISLHEETIASVVYHKSFQGIVQINDSLSLARNDVYGNLSFGLILISGSFNYDNLKRKSYESINVSRMFKTGVGAFSFWGTTGTFINMHYGFLTGFDKNHFEASAGAGVIFTNSGSIFLPSAQLGYRYQAPKGKGLFRVGLSFPEGVYLSIGTSF